MLQRPKVLVRSILDEEAAEILSEFANSVVKPSISREELIQEIADYAAILASGPERLFDDEILEPAVRLKIISRTGAGYDEVDIEAATRRGIIVTNTPGAMAETVAELTFLLALALLRIIMIGDRTVRSGVNWRDPNIWKSFRGKKLMGRTLGIVGLGNIGKRVARIAKAFGMKILATDQRPPPPGLLREIGTELVPLRELLQRSDVVTLHVPLTAQTYHMIGERELDAMKPDAILINTARGAVIDEKALTNALRNRKIAGAGLDVYEKEPPDPDCPLLKMDNVVLLPHVGGNTFEGWKNICLMAVDNVKKVLSGQKTQCARAHIVNPEVLQNARALAGSKSSKKD